MIAENCQSEGSGQGVHDGHGHHFWDEVPVAGIHSVGDFVPMPHFHPRDVEDNERDDGEKPSDDGTVINQHIDESM